MKIICVYDKLKKSVEIAEHIITRNLTLPILNNLLIKTEKNRVIISSTNLEIGIKSWFPCKIIEEGSISVPAKILSGIINNLSQGNIHLTTKKEKTLTITSSEYKGELKGQEAKDFPIIPQLKKDNQFNLDSKDLSSALSQTIPFTAISETRPEITGVFFHKEKNQEFLSLVSTDSFRLAEKKVFLKKEFKTHEFSFIIPQKTAAETLRFLSDTENISVVVEKNQVGYITPQAELVSRLIEGNYPDYTSFIPKEFKTEITIDREELIKNIRLVSLLSSRINDIRFSISSAKPANLMIYASDPDLGENSSSIKADFQGEPIEINFNWHYLLEGLQHIEGKRVNIKFVDSTKPALLRSLSDTSYLYIVMPIRT